MLPSLPMRLVLNSSISRACGRVPMEPSVIYSMELFSESPSSSKIYLVWFPDGRSLSLSEDMLSVTNIRPQISLSKNQAHSKYFSKLKTAQSRKWRSTNLREQGVLG